MTTSYWLNTATHFLESKSITTARLDCLVLLEDTLHMDRAQLLAEPTTEMKDAQVAHLQKLLSRRSKHEPLAYIRGHSEFYGRKFVVNAAVLEPRPESETMVDLLKGLPLFSSSKIGSECATSPEAPVFGPNSTNNGSGAEGASEGSKAAQTVKIADIGAGSGALGITAAIELEGASVDLFEIDPAAIKVAQFNVDRLTTGLRVIESDLLASASMDYDVLLCNLPYVPDDYGINKAASFEPAIALFGGPDGLDLYRKLFEQLATVQKRPLFILTESLPEQHAALAALAADNSYELQKTDDFIQLFAHKA
ncbi:MAG: putative Modification methylase, HemK family [Candidatus Saccharibacteria bacterium]|nr:putative Modification methylase, HemK family [Candidatus Saccharibacteria bacterium]